MQIRMVSSLNIQGILYFGITNAIAEDETKLWHQLITTVQELELQSDSDLEGTSCAYSLTVILTTLHIPHTIPPSTLNIQLE